MGPIVAKQTIERQSGPVLMLATPFSTRGCFCTVQGWRLEQ